MNQYEKDNIGRLRPYLAECTVLLKKNGRFPLEGPCRLAAYGSGVRFTVKGGTGSGEVNSRYFVNVEDGLKEAGFDVVGGEWSEAYALFEEGARKAFYADIKERARREKLNPIAASMGAVMKAPECSIPMDLTCDAAIYVVSRISGEGNDRLPEKGDFKLTDSEVRDILTLNSAYDKFMLVINAGGPVDLMPVMEAGNILVLSQLGVETGSALADILLGKAYPSGKLATTWSMIEDYSTAGDFGLRDDTCYREGIYVGYRYFDAFGAEPLFPFGYGLGYTDFAVETCEIKVSGLKACVNVKVTNTGGHRGKEAPQVYVSCPPGKLDKEKKSLAGFAKTPELAPGETATVGIEVDLRNIASYDEGRAAYVLERGDYIVLVGTSSADASPAAVLRLAEDVNVRQAHNWFGSTGFEDIRNITERNYDTEGLPVYELDPGKEEECVGNGANDNIDIVNSDGRRKSAIRHMSLDYMTDEDLAYLNIGGFDPKVSLSSVIGDSSSKVAGAAGETTKLLEGMGFPSIVMADGPAGVRISRKYYEDKDGKHTIGSPLPESMAEMLPAPVKMVLGREKVKKGVEVHEQFCTAIPIATAVAQSFNTEFAEVCGDIVASEMEIYGIDLWLAPALNIHRSVLCGRNFEYYSEDPLVSGKFAAAITRGVQKHHGCGVTIKHFAANNQETNRYASNSVISERALREIYLRGFEICVRESDPMAVMTSYNLLNGEHTSESRALTTEVLYKEFGFDGLVMTDWVIGGDLLLAKGSKYGTPDPAKVAAAGCSCFMPGRKNDHKQMLDGLRQGTVTAEQLKWNAGRLVRVLERLGK